MTANETAPPNRHPGETAHGSFGDFLAELRSLYPRALIGASGWERLLTLAHRLPIHVTDNRFGFEFDLSDPDPAADFCVVPAPGSRLAAFYARQGELAPPQSAEAALGASLGERASDHGPLSEGDTGVILEYDLAGLQPEQPAPPPGIFLVPRQQHESRTWKFFSDPEPLAAALWSAAGWTPDAAILRQMRRVYEATPPVGSVTQAGILPGRAQRAIRLIIHTESGEDAVEFLSRLRWPGPAADVLAVSESLEETTSPGVGLSVDVTAEGISPRLGLEFFRPVQWYELDHSGWTQLIDRLEEKGWCLPEKAQGLKDWPRVEQVFDQAGVFLARQSINHVKVVVNQGQRTTAKAYAGTAISR